ncbi:MAG: hypothetical protein QM642_01990 [Edaphocola sp.]
MDKNMAFAIIVAASLIAGTVALMGAIVYMLNECDKYANRRNKNKKI